MTRHADCPRDLVGRDHGTGEVEGAPDSQSRSQRIDYDDVTRLRDWQRGSDRNQSSRGSLGWVGGRPDAHYRLARREKGSQRSDLMDADLM